MMFRRFTGTAAALAAAVLLSLNCFAAPATCARSMILMDADTGAILLEKD